MSARARTSHACSRENSVFRGGERSVRVIYIGFCSRGECVTVGVFDSRLFEISERVKCSDRATVVFGARGFVFSEYRMKTWNFSFRSIMMKFGSLEFFSITETNRE